jgi:hypothetical protein
MLTLEEWKFYGFVACEAESAEIISSSYPAASNLFEFRGLADASGVSASAPELRGNERGIGSAVG